MNPISVDLIFNNKFNKIIKSNKIIYNAQKNSYYKIKLTNNTNKKYICKIVINNKSLKNIIVNPFNYTIIDSFNKLYEFNDKDNKIIYKDIKFIFNGIKQNIQIEANHENINDTKWIKPRGFSNEKSLLECRNDSILENNKLIFLKDIFFEETNKPDYLIDNFNLYKVSFKEQKEDSAKNFLYNQKINITIEELLLEPQKKYNFNFNDRQFEDFILLNAYY